MDYRPFGLLDMTPGFPAGGVAGRTPSGADDLGRLLYSMTGAGGAQDAAGLLGGPSVRENLRSGNNFDAGLQMLAALPVVGMLGTAGKVAKAGSLTERLASKFPQIDFALSEAGSGPMTLSKVVVPTELRGQGIGTEFMRDVLAHADEIGRPVALSPSSDFGGNKSKLTEWYKSLGFTPNKGRSKDFTTRETMIRQPVAGSLSNSPLAVGAFETMFGAIPATGALKPYKPLGPLAKSNIDTPTFTKSNSASYGASSVSDANMRKYGVKDVEEVANKLAKMLQERGANVKLNRAESFPYNDIQSTPKVSYYISNLNDPDYLIKDLGQIRISDHDGGWGSRRLAKQASIDLSKNGGILEEDLNKRFDDIIRQHYHFYDPERVAAEIKQKTEEAQNAANVKREAAQNIYDDVMRQNQGNRRAHDRAIREARKVYSTFSPPTKPNSGS